MAKTEKKTADIPLLSVKISEDLKTVTYAVKGYDPLVLTTSNLSADTVENCKALAIANKIRDMIANYKSDTHTDADRYEVIQAAVSHFNSGGDWSAMEKDGAEFPLLCAAMARVYPATSGTVEKVKATLTKTMTAKGFKEQKQAVKYWLSVGPVAEMVLTIKTERLAAKPAVDSDETLAELLAG